MEPITLGRNIEEIISRVLVTRDELEIIKNSIKNIATDNIDEIDNILQLIVESESIIDNEWNNYLKEWKTMILEFNSFIDESEWDKSIRDNLLKNFTNKLNLYLNQLLTIAKTIEEYFIELLDEKYTTTTTGFNLDKNPYLFNRDDISEKSKNVREVFSLPDSIGYGWHSIKVYDDYLATKKALLCINKFNRKYNGSKLDIYLKGSSIHETLIFHPDYGILNYVSNGMNRDNGGLVDHESRSQFIKVQIKNNDDFKGQFNEMKSYHYLKDIENKKVEVEHGKNLIPEFYGILRNYIEEDFERLNGDKYLIVKLKDNLPLQTNTPKIYQISKIVSDKESILEDFNYSYEDDRYEDFKSNISALTPYPINSDVTEYGSSDNHPANSYSIGKEEFDTVSSDSNSTFVKHFPIITENIKPFYNSSEFLNIQSNSINRIAHFMYIDSQSAFQMTSLLLSNNINDLKNNIIFYKRRSYGKFRKEYDLFRNWVLKILPPDFTPIDDTKFLMWDYSHKSKLSQIKGINRGIIYGESPKQVFEDDFLNLFIINTINSYYKEDNVDVKILYNDYVSRIIKSKGLWNTVIGRLTRFNYHEYFDLFDSPNKYNDYFFTPFINVDKNPSEENNKYFKGLVGNYDSYYSKNISESEEGEISDNISLNHSSRSLLNRGGLTEEDELEIMENFYLEMDEKYREYNKLTIGTIKFIPYDINNPDFLGSYVKAGTKLKKSEYPDAYSLFGDMYAYQYEEDMEEDEFGTPILYDRFLEYTNTDADNSIGKLQEDQFPDFGYTMIFDENPENKDLREGFISENKETYTAISLSNGDSDGYDKRKIKITHNTNSNITSGHAFKLDYYIKVK